MATDPTQHVDTDPMQTSVTDAPDQHRYEVRRGGALAGFAAYLQDGQVRIFTHTEIDDAYEGQGIGGGLARAALDDVRARGMRVVAQCPFIAGWIARHPDYADLVEAPPPQLEPD